MKPGNELEVAGFVHLPACRSLSTNVGAQLPECRAGSRARNATLACSPQAARPASRTSSGARGKVAGSGDFLAVRMWTSREDSAQFPTRLGFSAVTGPALDLDSACQDSVAA